MDMSHVAEALEAVVTSVVDQNPIPLDVNQNNGIEEGKEIETSCTIKFYPPVGIQRYAKIREVLDKFLEKCDPEVLKSILEVGCANFRLHTYMRSLHGSVQKVVYMDIDKDLLESRKQEITPLCCDFLKRRETPLVVEAYAGDIVKCDTRILNMTPGLFAVVAIEVIEHLDDDVLEGFEKTVFGVLRPPLVLITTPNSEFNVLFNLEPGKYRHWDHRFEWSRFELACWCRTITANYPEYKFEMSGIGEGPKGTEHLGCVSQLVVFTRDVTQPPIPTTQDLSGIVQDNCYSLISHIDYPWFVDTSSRSEIIIREFQYYVNMYKLNSDNLQQYYMDQTAEISMSMQEVADIYAMPLGVDKEEVRKALTDAGKRIFHNEDLDEYRVMIPVEYPDDSDPDEPNYAPCDDLIVPPEANEIEEDW